MKKFTTLGVSLLSLLVAMPVFAASSKTTAACGAISVVPAAPAAFADAPLTTISYKDRDWVKIMSSDIRTANPSDLFADVSLECGLTTETTVKSRGGTKDTATAEASVQIFVMLDEGTADERMFEPEEVTFCKRTQTLSATLEGQIADCLIFVPEFAVDPTTGEETDVIIGGSIVLDPTCEVTYEEISLMLDTMNANAFNFLLPDVGVGDHTVSVWASINNFVDSGNGSAEAYGTLGKGSMAIEEVKMIKDADTGL